MGKQFRVTRKVATIQIQPGSFQAIDLPRQYDVEAIFMRLSGSVQVTTAATSVRSEAPTQAVSRVEVIADGKNNLFSAPFWYASLGNYGRNLAEQGSRVVTPPTAAAVATYPFEAIGVIDFQTVDGARPKDSNFRTSALSLFQLRATFGQALDMFVPGAGVAVYSGTATLEIFVQECVELPDTSKPAGQQYTNPIALKKISYQELTIQASNANQEIRLPAGNLIKSVLFRTDGLTTAGEPVTTMLNNIQLAAGVDVRMNISGAQLRAKNNADRGNVPAGYYFADVTDKGTNDVNLTDLWDVSNQAEPKAILDVTGGATGKMQAVITEYILANAG